MPRPALSVSVVTTGNGVAAFVAGEIDLSTIDLFVDTLTDLTRGEPTGNLVVDLTGVSFMGAAAVQALATAQQDAEAHGWAMRVHVTHHSWPQRVLTLTSAHHAIAVRVREMPVGEHFAS